ncbi:hypothetical protein PISL3812_05526 [Talaromyces islandicus]|uniref:Uncharacterized protein n=1 Tax=Talaromyces islandicus TaxID=28573 RepID=A0A0U1LYS8_TALIS|nr:hypothetical protein PISL3812_05526 [Talaromyces islandicus]
MPRGSRPSSRHRSRPNSSSKSNEKDYALSANIYGQGRQGNPPAHWGAMLHRRGETNGDLYHVRKAMATTKTQLRDVWENNSNLPRGDANCQDWTRRGLWGRIERQIRLSTRSEFDALLVSKEAAAAVAQYIIDTGILEQFRAIDPEALGEEAPIQAVEDAQTEAPAQGHCACLSTQKRKKKALVRRSCLGPVRTNDAPPSYRVWVRRRNERSVALRSDSESALARQLQLSGNAPGWAGSKKREQLVLTAG